MSGRGSAARRGKTGSGGGGGGDSGGGEVMAVVRAIGRVAPMAAAGGLLGLTSLALLWQETQGRFVAGVQVDPGSALLRLLMPTLFWAVFAVVGVVAVGSNLLTRLASAPSVVAALANFLPPAGASLVPRPPPPANALGSCGSPPH